MVLSREKAENVSFYRDKVGLGSSLEMCGPERGSRWLTKALLKGDYSQMIARIILRLCSDDRSTIRPSTKSCLIPQSCKIVLLLSPIWEYIAGFEISFLY